ncbi:MAG: hypothetical protein ACI8WB_005250 [Phenylobacterium sp.]|jgi:hypothetical protein
MKTKAVIPVAQLNDELRIYGAGGRVILTQAIADLLPNERLAVIQAVREFEEFSQMTDPHMEHAFGVLMVNGRKVFWKIDYDYKRFLNDTTRPGDAAAIVRQLTVMLADEY